MEPFNRILSEVKTHLFRKEQRSPTKPSTIAKPRSRVNALTSHSLHLRSASHLHPRVVSDMNENSAAFPSPSPTTTSSVSPTYQ